VGEKWWQGFGDAQLNAFVQQALVANVDVRVAAGRVEEAAAGLADVAGARLPQIDASAGAGARRSMGTGVFGGMLLDTFVATLFIPLFFKILTGDRKEPRA
jgi:outer membrane protein TolC